MLNPRNQPSHPEPGAKWGARDFLHLYAWLEAQTADVLRSVVSSGRFGLLVPTSLGSDTFCLKVVGEELELKSVFAVLPNGRFALVCPPSLPVVKKKVAELEEGQYDVLLGVNIAARLPLELPAVEGAPEQRARSVPKCFLSIIPVCEAEPSYRSSQLKIGRLVKEDVSVYLLPYMPPVFHLAGLPQLWSQSRDYQKKVKDLYFFSKEIVRKTSGDSGIPALEGLHRLAYLVADYLAQNKFAFQHLDPQSNPSMLLAFCSGLAGVFHLFLETFTQESELLDLFRRYVQDRAGYQEFLRRSFKVAVRNLAELEYDPLDLQAAVKVLDRFFEAVYPAWQELGEATQIIDLPGHEGVVIRQ